MMSASRSRSTSRAAVIRGPHFAPAAEEQSKNLTSKKTSRTPLLHAFDVPGISVMARRISRARSMSLSMAAQRDSQYRS
jgi:hypothetical protein